MNGTRRSVRHRTQAHARRGRNSGVGLTGAFGSAFAGRWDMPFKISQVLAIDPFGDLTIGAMSGQVARQGGFDNRANNVLQYWTPALGGLVARAAVTSNEAKSDEPAVPGSAAGCQSAHLRRLARMDDEAGHGIAAKYTMGEWQASAQYGQYDRTGTEKQKSGAVNLQATFGVHQAIASFRKSNDGGLSGTEQPKCDGWALAYRYLFDRNLDFIALVTRVDNKSGGLCDFGQNGVGAAARAGGGDPQGVAAGLRYTF